MAIFNNYTQLNITKMFIVRNKNSSNTLQFALSGILSESRLFLASGLRLSKEEKHDTYRCG
jgi:hypothetical protein